MHSKSPQKTSPAFLIRQEALLRGRLEDAVLNEEFAPAVEMNRHLEQIHRALAELGFTPHSTPGDEFRRVFRANRLSDHQNWEYYPC